jgi:hypothetical protein
MARYFASSLQSRTAEQISKAAFAAVLLITGMAYAQTKQAAQDAAARKRFAETEQQSIVQKEASNPVPGFKIAAEGPNFTVFVYHVPGITSEQCGSIFSISPTDSNRNQCRRMRTHPVLLKLHCL